MRPLSKYVKKLIYFSISNDFKNVFNESLGNSVVVVVVDVVDVVDVGIVV